MIKLYVYLLGVFSIVIPLILIALYFIFKAKRRARLNKNVRLPKRLGDDEDGNGVRSKKG